MFLWGSLCGVWGVSVSHHGSAGALARCAWATATNRMPGVEAVGTGAGPVSKPQIRLKSRIRRTLSTGMRSQFAHVWSTGALAHRPDASGTKIGRGVAVSLCVASVGVADKWRGFLPRHARMPPYLAPLMRGFPHPDCVTVLILTKSLSCGVLAVLGSPGAAPVGHLHQPYRGGLSDAKATFAGLHVATSWPRELRRRWGTICFVLLWRGVLRLRPLRV